MVFLLVSAHNAKSPLPSLLSEFDSISESLRPLVERLMIKLEFKVNAENPDIIKLFSRLGGKIGIFHYSGHSNGERLGIKEGGHIRGIAELFGFKAHHPNSQSPKCVFLNGCGTIQQVAALHREGVKAVIATHYPIEDNQAFLFATSFYQHWVQEGESLKSAFNFAIAALHNMAEYKKIEIHIHRDTSNFDTQTNDQPAWGLFLNPDLTELGQAEIFDFKINPTPKLPPLILQRVRTESRESLRELAHDFRMAMVNKRFNTNDPILSLIERLPWIVGTHLRRLFVQETGSQPLENNLKRLKDIDCAYTELLRFINNILAALLWDQQSTLVNLDKKEIPPPFCRFEEATKVDYLSSIRQYLAILDSIEGDPIAMETHIKQFLEDVDGKSGLFDSHKFMAELHLALHDPNPNRLGQLLSIRYSSANDYNKICLEAEAIYGSFLRATLFLKEYRLLSVWSISVDRFKFIDTQVPYSYKVIDLHGAFGDVDAFNMYEERHGDSYCIVLVPRQQSDEVISLENLLNLSPFYIDKNAFLELRNKAGYPSIFALQYQSDPHSFLYTCIDQDQNFDYHSKVNQELTIQSNGAVFPDVLEISYDESQRFAKIYEQLIRLHLDFSSRD